VAANARIAYYDWLRATAQIAAAERSLDSARARLEDARLGLAAGTLADADVQRLHGLVASGEVAVQQAVSFERLARDSLVVLIGKPEDGAEFAIGEDVYRDAVESPAGSAGGVDEYIARSYANRPEIVALQVSIQSLEHGVDAAAVGTYPRLDGIASYTYANPNQRYFPVANDWHGNWFVGLTATWKLDQYLNSRLTIDELQVTKRTYEARLAALRQAVEVEVTTAWEQRQRARAELAISQRRRDAAEAVYEQRVQLYRAGEATTTDIIEAEVERLEASLRDVDARIDLRVAETRLQRAIGDHGVAPPVHKEVKP